MNVMAIRSHPCCCCCCLRREKSRNSWEKYSTKKEKTNEKRRKKSRVKWPQSNRFDMQEVVRFIFASFIRSFFFLSFFGKWQKTYSTTTTLHSVISTALSASTACTAPTSFTKNEKKKQIGLWMVDDVRRAVEYAAAHEWNTNGMISSFYKL